MSIIEVKNLKKSYGPASLRSGGAGKTEAVRGISFAVSEGEVFGLLGPNGAGKTTTMEILEGLLRPDSGTVKVGSKHPGIVLQQSGFLAGLTIGDLLELFAGLYNQQELPKDLAAQFELEGLLDKEYKALSGGQKQRFVLACALLHRPKVLFLDEPTVGLDPRARQRFWEIILDLQKKGLTILLTTHYMEEAEIVCDRVGIIDHGRIVACDRPVKLINSLGVVSHIQFMSSKPVNVGQLEQLPGIISARHDRYTYDLETKSPEVSLRELLEWEKNFSGKVFNLQVQQATLEDVFLKLTGHSLRE